ncbi:unnamed protein product [Dovyalis caffra]|uniref:Uncharacterized protein n=1 Tax=Dovyalis caffra TaxID=77055 RepID=A0AAV1RE09_9ROSI|nr:unnamed protein product [Dovyalis caffra]
MDDDDGGGGGKSEKREKWSFEAGFFSDHSIQYGLCLEQPNPEIESTRLNLEARATSLSTQNRILSYSKPNKVIDRAWLPIPAQYRAPHGLVYENPVAFSPSAVEFFHPKTQEPNTKSPCAASSSCSPLPLAAQLETTDQAQESKISTSQKGGNRLRAGGIAGIVLGVAFAVLLTMGVYYVMVTRKANIHRANSVQPNA